ncbi:hypothetical protein [Rhizobium sp. SL42]|uniref:hypothetical protein n=1 Tax=Rhizobium sp. SL42 TaxID=2806346 RepID=UPI001F24F14B|nr:hypothetical protein [Rhizobium sp. SL42]UJW77696.1 hypothetical protein IM739_22530 [Rhizobium sp. SL42]
MKKRAFWILSSNWVGCSWDENGQYSKNDWCLTDEARGLFEVNSAGPVFRRTGPERWKAGARVGHRRVIAHGFYPKREDGFETVCRRGCRGRNPGDHVGVAMIGVGERKSLRPDLAVGRSQHAQVSEKHAFFSVDTRICKPRVYLL